MGTQVPLERRGWLKLYADYEEMLKSDIDMVVVASDGPLHAAHSCMALEASKHVQSEVPADYTMEGCLRIVEAVGDSFRLELEASCLKGEGGDARLVARILKNIIHELKRSEYLKVLPLFKEPHLSLVISSVAECNSPARIWVDDPISPQTAFIWNMAHSFYLVGTPDNEGYNSAVEGLMHEQIMPEARKRELYVFKLYGSLEVWQAISKSFLSKKIERKARRFYAFKRRGIDSPKGEIPYGFAMKRIDARFFRDYNLKNSPGLEDEISSSWNSFDDYLQKGFGFALVHGEEVACWCAAEDVSKNKCGIGIETIPKYQRRGFATLTACTFVDHCTSNGITPHWDCWDDNIGSIRVAEKVGFELVEKYDVFFGSLS